MATAILCAIRVTTAQQNLAVNWSSNTYGPDGPWNAITINVGGNQNSTDIESEQVSIDLLVGSYYASYIPSSSACRAYGPQCGNGGVWDPDTIPIKQPPPNIWDAPSFINITGTVYPGAVTIGTAGKQQTVYDVDLASIDTFSVKYPNEVTAAPELGFFALNSGMDKEIRALSDAKGSEDPWIVAGSLYNQFIIPSYSYGLQIGSAALNYSGSLVLGGYDKGRIIGPYTSCAGYMTTLLDITMDVETGPSPFSFGNASKLLTNVLGQPSSLSVKPDPMPPGLHLPAQTCSNLAQKLPVYYDSTTNYYLWNTSDPSYEQIINSPAYLGFQFTPAPGDEANVTIKVPFKLLNLTLTSPVVTRPVQYFPCIPFDRTPADQWRLGRAFLQAAFLGYNTHTNTMWLAQAPGPGVANEGLGLEPQDIANSATTLEVYSDKTLFADSWAGHWTATKATEASNSTSSAPADPTSTTTTNEHQPGISGGAIGGAVVGVVAGIAIIAAIIFCLVRKKSKQSTLQQSSDEGLEDTEIGPERGFRKQQSTSEGYTFLEMPTDHEVEELPNHAESKELPTSMRVYELESPLNTRR
ncbi:hypothetical protein M436DRAFT_67114 [Aureobasidium namibiae CBS 147.97]|uniref:Peptidase A1 domain-containing protein n=1 Tax=Aureobasidium namibiae CBS 147.97 TaxID=1043004 RepID=A0A074W953_9PEZI